MLAEEAGYLIMSITNSGNKFRPSDWVERIASTCGSFDWEKRLHYSPMVKPVYSDGVRCLYLASRLQETNPDVYNYVMNFCYRNDLKLIEVGAADIMLDVA